MKIELHSRFKKSYKRRVLNNRKLVQKIAEKIDLFRKDSKNPILKDHELTGSKRNYRAFSLTGDIRILYLRVSDNHVIFLDIGTHNQVY